MRRLLTGCCLLLAAALARADRFPLPPDVPPAYLQECGSCHLPYPPQLLAAADWQRVMQGLAQHFGSDAAVDRKAAQAILLFLERHAAPPSRALPLADAPRISATPWFQREHRRLTPAIWQRPAVRSPAHCEACHRQAESGSFHEREIRIPGAPR